MGRMCNLIKHHIFAGRIDMFVKVSWTVVVFWVHIHFSLGGPCGNSTSNYSSAVAARFSASVFLFYYSLLFDDFPTAECQRAGGGTGLGAGRIYCHDAGDRLHGSVPWTAYTLQQNLQTRPTTSASMSRGGKSPKISRSRDTYFTAKIYLKK